jgi:hypothetical protein
MDILIENDNGSDCTPSRCDLVTLQTFITILIPATLPMTWRVDGKSS